MKIFRSLLIALALLSLIACGDDGGSLNGEDLVDSGVEDDAAVKPPPGDDDDGDDGAFELTFRVINEQENPYTGAIVRVLGGTSRTGVVDEAGEVSVKVESEGDHIVIIEGLGDDWSLVYPILREFTEENEAVVTMPSAAFTVGLAEATEVEISDNNGLVIFEWDVPEIGGQSVALNSGDPFIRIADEELEEDESPFRPGSGLESSGEPIVLYLNVGPGALAMEYSSTNAGETCDHLLEPSGGWQGFERTIVFIPVRCHN